MILYYFVYILMAFYVIKVSKRTLHMLQQNLYNENNRYLGWIFENRKDTIINYSVIGIIISFIILFVENNIIELLLVLLMAIYLISFLKEQKISSKNQNKKPLVYTPRVKRLIITHLVIYFIFILLGIIKSDYINVFLFILSVLCGLSFFTTFITMIINYPIEKCVYKHYEKKS